MSYDKAANAGTHVDPFVLCFLKDTHTHTRTHAYLCVCCGHHSDLQPRHAHHGHRHAALEVVDPLHQMGRLGVLLRAVGKRVKGKGQGI